MIITRPLKNAEDLVIVYDLIDPKQLSMLTEYWISSLYHIYPQMTDEERKELGYEPSKEPHDLYDLIAGDILNKIKTNTTEVMNSEYGDFRVRRFQDFGAPALRSRVKGGTMKPHLDGPPEYNRPFEEHQVDSLGANFYLNDDYEGGELYYPELDFYYKPVPNSVVIHRGDSTDLYRHGVSEVKSGWRLGFGMFAFNKDYELPQLKQGMDSDK
jgi:hypothetical protein